ncbi:hypothetical protein TUBRATIS_006680 [Tubulinosema ratisbonensis]|uniref:Uncharacterized protein n=1 Tax=Tubulinosema ratisbonensis TaxID=291195 RepID=A0A437ANM3_9MICR|nr:hypothetical protein TUBRATIS_006680 [Tubulinosema ratisbonensis]
MKFYYDNFVLSITISLYIYAIIFLFFILYELKRFLWGFFRLKETPSKRGNHDNQTHEITSLFSSITVLFLFIYFWLVMSTENFLVFYFTFLYYLNCKVVCIFFRLSDQKSLADNTFNSYLVTKMLNLLSVIFILYLKSFSLYLESKLTSVS